MSDCSTNAMKPKERPTCGTCRHAIKPFIVCANEEGVSYEVKAGTTNSTACGNYEPEPIRDFDRLAEVAAKLWREYRACWSLGRAPSEHTVDDFKQALSDCGVEV